MTWRLERAVNFHQPYLGCDWMTRDVLVDVGGVKGGDRIHRGHVRDRSDQVRINGGERGKGRVSVHREGDPEVEANELSINRPLLKFNSFLVLGTPYSLGIDLPHEAIVWS